MNTNDKTVTINYAGLDFTLDFSKRGVPEIYCRGELLKPSYNKPLNRWYIQVYLGKDYASVFGAHKHAKWDVGYYSTPRYRLVAAGMEKLRNGEFDYEKFKGMQVDHIDNNPQNDVPSNLRWTTRKRNNSRKNARMMKSENYACNKHDGEIVKATKDGEERLFKNVNQCCRELGFSHVLGYRVINKSDYAKTAKGWTLEYVPLTYGVLDKSDVEEEQ